MEHFEWKIQFKPQNNNNVDDFLVDDVGENVGIKDGEEFLRGTESATKKWIAQDNEAEVFKWFMVHGRYVNEENKVDKFAVNVKIRYNRNKSVIIDTVHKLLVRNGFKHPVIDNIYMKVL